MSYAWTLHCQNSKINTGQGINSSDLMKDYHGLLLSQFPHDMFEGHKDNIDLHGGLQALDFVDNFQWQLICLLSLDPGVTESVQVWCDRTLIPWQGRLVDIYCETDCWHLKGFAVLKGNWTHCPVVMHNQIDKKTIQVYWSGERDISLWNCGYEFRHNRTVTQIWGLDLLA